VLPFQDGLATVPLLLDVKQDATERMHDSSKDGKE
jgi:hypothetical protein